MKHFKITSINLKISIIIASIKNCLQSGSAFVLHTVVSIMQSAIKQYDFCSYSLQQRLVVFRFKMYLGKLNILSILVVQQRSQVSLTQFNLFLISHILLFFPFYSKIVNSFQLSIQAYSSGKLSNFLQSHRVLEVLIPPLYQSSLHFFLAHF